MAQAAEQSALSSGSDAVSVSVSDCDLSSGSGLKCCCKYYSASASASYSLLRSLSLPLSVRKRLLNLLYNLVSILFPQSELPVFFGFCARFVPVRRRSLFPLSASFFTPSHIEFYYRKLYYYYVLHSLQLGLCLRTHFYCYVTQTFVDSVASSHPHRLYPNANS